MPDWVFWLLVAVLPGLYTARLLWTLWGPASKPPPTRMTPAAVIALVDDAIRQQWPEWAGEQLHIADWPRPANAMHWTVRQASVGSWWIGRVDDQTGEVRHVRREGVR